MTEKSSTEKVEIFGQEYKIKGAGDPEYIHRIAGYVDSKMREIAHSSGIMSQSHMLTCSGYPTTDSGTSITSAWLHRSLDLVSLFLCFVGVALG